MEDFKIQPINAINIQRVLSSPNLTDEQKAEYIHKNAVEIKQVMKTEISKDEFAHLMQNRPLIRFRPLKNSFTKKGDKILLAKALGITASDVENYITNIIETNFDIEHDVTKENIEKVKTYVFRHGKKDEVAAFLDYELSNVKTVLKKLYKIMDDNSGGLVEYFSRPIHRMDNRTLTKLYKVIDKRLKDGLNAGEYSEEKYLATARWALIKIYQIQNNSKILRAYNCNKFHLK